jgi:hypothetical protein
MSCMLRIFGTDLNLNDLLKINLTPSSTREKGAPRFPASQPHGKENLHSGANYVVSDADFDEFEDQVADAIEFLEKNKTHVQAMVKLPGAEQAVLDFGVWWRDKAIQSASFPPKLCRLAGNLGLWLELSQYPPAEEDDENE